MTIIEGDGADRRLRAQPRAAQMLSLASLSPLFGLAVRLLWVAGIAGLAVFAVAAAGGPGDPRGDAYRYLYIALFVVAAALCLLRARLVDQQRLTWALFGAAMLLWAAAELVYFRVLPSENVPFPSMSDALWLTSYGMSLAAVLALMRSGLSHVRASVWIDALVGGLALAALAAGLLVEPIIASTGGSIGAVATNLAYPLLDVLILGLLIGVFVVSNGRPGRIWGLLGVVWMLQAGVDAVYLYEAAAGRWEHGTLVNASWPALMFLIAFAAWHKPAVTTISRDQGWWMLAMTSGFAIAGLLLISFHHRFELNETALVLARLTVLAAFVRMALIFGDMRTLASGRELSMRNTLILEAAGEGIIGTDANGAITFANAAAARMTGYALDELPRRDLHECLHHTKPDGTPYPVQECPMHVSLHDGTIHHCDSDVYWRKDGSCFPVEYTSTPIVDGARIHGAVVVFRDITERRQVEEVKDQFTSVVSHELRTPLTSIRGSLGLLGSGVLGPQSDTGQRMIQIAVENTDRLVRLINDILDLERIDSDALHLLKSPCDAETLIARATEAMLPAAAAAGVTLTVHAAPAPFEADADRLTQTLTNLIGNAVKFSPAGGTVHITSEHRDGEMLFCVSDHGRGIPSDKLETIFGRFEQVDASDSRQKGGTGLGLAICRSIVEHHGGRIWAMSAPNAGSTFSFVVPAGPGDAEYVPRADGERGSVLLCDDNREFLEVTGRTLEERGYRVILARSGDEAIERATAERPNAILLDMQLPGMSGSATAAALQELPETSGIPVVVLTVLPRRDSDMALGWFADWIEKPAADATLFAALERAIGAHDHTFQVLCLQADATTAEILHALFARHGVASLAATDAREATELCARVSPDLIVLDEDLAAIDGITAKDWLGRDKRASELPIVTYDARDVADAERERLVVGSVSQILSKGQITFEEFQWRVMTLLARPRTPNRPPETSHETEAHTAGR